MDLTKEEILETSMVDLAYKSLDEKGEPMSYQDILTEVSKLKGFTEEDIERYIAQLYTDLNVDGRFVLVGRNLWGIKRWYPIEQTNNFIVPGLKDEFEEDLEETLLDEDNDLMLEEVADGYKEVADDILTADNLDGVDEVEEFRR